MTIEKKSLFRDRSRIVKISICLFVGFIVMILFWNAYRLYYSSSTKGRTDRLSAIPEIPTELTDILKELNVHSDIKYLIKRSGISSLRLHLEFELSPNNFVDFFSDGLEYSDLLNDDRFYIMSEKKSSLSLVAIVDRFEKSGDIPFQTNWEGKTKTELPVNIQGIDLYGSKTITVENDNRIHFMIDAVYDIESKIATFQIYSTRRF